MLARFFPVALRQREAGALQMGVALMAGAERDCPAAPSTFR